MRGNKPQKTTSALQDARPQRTARRSMLALVGDEPREVPPAPRGLGRLLTAHWYALWEGTAGRFARDEDSYDIVEYFRLLKERDRVRRRVLKVPTVEGSVGNDVVNPQLHILKELTREIEKYREQLGILPLNRMRLGDETGKAGASLLAFQRGLREVDDDRDGGEVIDLGELG